MEHTPLLLFSFDRSDGDYLSILLSNHLEPFYKNSTRRINNVENYFSTAAIRHFIYQTDENVNREPSAVLKLALDEGFDTRQLYGLCLPAAMIGSIDFDHDFAGAKIIVVYNEFLIKDPKDISALDAVKRFIEQYENQVHVINSKYLISKPGSVLNYVASLLNAVTVRMDEILPHSALSPKLLTDKKDRLLNADDRAFFLQREHQLAETATIQAAHCEILFVVNDAHEEKVWKLKMIQLLTLFPDKVALKFICTTAETADVAASFTKSLNINYFDLSIITAEGPVAFTINEIVKNSEAQFILIDLLRNHFSYALVLEALCRSAAAIVFPSVQNSGNIREISLNDLLTISIPEAGLFFDKNVWKETCNFHTDIHRDYMYWDFAIRTMQQNASCFSIPASELTDRESTEASESEAFANTYKQVIAKHYYLIEQSLEAIISQMSTGNLYTLQERKQLQKRISSLQSVLSHSKEELLSFQQLTAQLQQRIHHLENNWYQRLRIRVVRIKKIFFKKKSPGTGTLKRILLFIRFLFSKAGFGIFRKILKNVLKRMYLFAENRPVQIRYLDESNNEDIFTYDDWIKSKLDEPKQSAYYKEHLENLPIQPLISIIMPVYNTPLKFLKEAIESVLKQQYPNWELCIADDHSDEMKVKKMLHTYAVKDSRIKVVYRSENGHISAASNSALEITTGEYVLLMDHDDLLSPNCVAEVVLAINQKPQSEIIYSDEDKIEERGYQQAPHFKPDWAPDHLLSRNYMGHVVVLKKSLIDLAGGFRIGFEGSQDYDLLLRATELTSHITHIPKVLYHWRIHHLSAAQGEDVKPYAYIAAKKALGEALERRGLEGNVKYLSGLRGYSIDYKIKEEGKVSIIIPTKDQTELLKNTIDSIIEKTSYKNYEIIILNNNSTSRQLSDFLVQYTARYPEIIKCVDAHFPFNFSKLMNLGVSYASGAYFLLLNNDVEVIHDDWLSTMVSYAQQKRIGAVGVKLLYPDDTIQHAGVVIGLGGIAGHAFVGAYKEEPGYFNYIQSVNNYSAVTAACMLVRRQVFEAVNGMDESFEVEYNDVDFCLKLIEAGYNNVYLPQVELYHYESATRGHPHQSKVSYERHLKEMKLFKEKWQHFIDHDPFYNPNLNLGVHDFGMNFNA